jgi:hypothetical protein
MGQIFMKLRRRAPLFATVGLLGVSAAGAAGETPPFFVPHAVVAAGTHVKDFAVADFSGDGTPDLAVVAGSSSHWKTDTVAVLLGLGGGAFRAGPGSPAKLSAETAGVWTADFNGDGKADAVVSQYDDSYERVARVSILLGNGAGALTRAPGSPLALPGLAAVADLNRDGKTDLIAVDDDRVVSWLGDGTGRFTRSAQPALPDLEYRPRVVVADFNGDGQSDLAVGPLKKGAAVLLGLGSGRFAAARRVTAATGPLAAADFDGDGKPDLAVAGKTLTILLGDGVGGFTRAPGSPLKADYRTGISAADLNGDSRVDIAAVHDNSLVVLLGSGGGRFHRVRGSRALPFFAPGVFGAADLTGDRNVDLAARVQMFSASPGHGAEEGDWRVVILSQERPAPTPAVSRGRSLPHSADTQLSIRGAITKLAADGDRAAALATGKGGGSCSLGNRVLVWNASSRKATSLEGLRTPQCFGGQAPDTTVEELAIGGDTVAWITESEVGNTQGWHDLFVAKLSGGAAKRIDHVSGRDSYPADGGWLGYLRGGRRLLAYDKWQTFCEPPPGYGCGSRDAWIRVGRTSLMRIAGGRRIVTKRGAGSYRLDAVGGGRMAVEAADGSLRVLAPTGARIATVPSSNGDLPLSIALSSTRLAVVRWSRTLDLYNPATGAKGRSLPLGDATPVTLAGVNDRLALLQRPGRLVLVRLRDGRVISLPLPPHLAGAALTERGLFYAYSVRRARKSRIVFEPTAALLKRF